MQSMHLIYSWSGVKKKKKKDNSIYLTHILTKWYSKMDSGQSMRGEREE